MITYKKISLREHNTFGIDVTADAMAVVSTPEEAASLAGSRLLENRPYIVTGKGSNLLFLSDYHGTIIKSGIEGINVAESGDDHALVCAGSGVDWDTLVEWSVENGFGGLENLSLIPGSVGAAPVQNIGAYGSEVKSAVEKVMAVSVQNGTKRDFSFSECRFGYRNSIFKNELKGQWFITQVLFRLNKNPLLSYSYSGLKDEAERLGGLTLRNIRQAVMNIRNSKLPDTNKTGNAGSFFKNPVINNQEAEVIRRKYAGAAFYDDPSGGVKIPAGWLIEQCGWKGKRIGDAGVWEKQALVLVNYGNASGRDILELSEMISKSVFEKFGILLEREVEVVE